MIASPQKLSESGQRPLRVMFITTRMMVGGEEMLLVDLIRRLDRGRFRPELCCLKFRGELGEMLATDVPVFAGLLKHKADVRVWGRLTRLLRQRKIDAVVTVGTGGDKMFWGRLAAARARVPVIVSAIHSTGWPLRVEWLNRRLAPLTDAFIAVADRHRQHIVRHEGCPAARVHVIHNGVDVQRFRPRPADRRLQGDLRIPADAPVVGVVAAMRQEKNLSLWLRAAAEIRTTVPAAHFLIVGFGPLQDGLERQVRTLGLDDRVRFTGKRTDIPDLLALMDVFQLSSDMEANPVSILEAMACGKAVVSTAVGSIPEVVRHGHTGLLVPAGDAMALAAGTSRILSQPRLSDVMGQRGRQRVVHKFAVDQMVMGYEALIQQIYHRKRGSLVSAQPREMVNNGQRRGDRNPREVRQHA